LLAKAVHQGTVKQLLAISHRDDYLFVHEALVDDLIHEAQLPEAQARWAVESWGLALGKYPLAARQSPTPPQSKHGLPHPSAASRAQSARENTCHMIAGAISGALGGGLGPGVLLGLQLALVGSMAKAAPAWAPDRGQSLLVALVVGLVVYTVGGVLGGAIGGTVGLYVCRSIAGTRGEGLFWAYVGALMGALAGGVAGSFLCGVFGLFLGSLIGGWTGAFSAGLKSGVR
jgi:hypothetical protein